MNLLRDPSASIQYEAFHVFKIFVANPRKSEHVMDVLLRNRERLLTFLEGFLKQREAQDEHFREEKAFLIEEVRRFGAAAPGPSSASAAGSSSAAPIS